MQVDITVNNILAIVNTKLLADYVKPGRATAAAVLRRQALGQTAPGMPSPLIKAVACTPV